MKEEKCDHSCNKKCDKEFPHRSLNRKLRQCARSAATFDDAPIMLMKTLTPLARAVKFITGAELNSFYKQMPGITVIVEKTIQ